MLFLRRILSISITPRLTLVLLTILSTMSLAEAKRVALVIGNSDYLYTPALTNPTNDAKAVSLSLERLGFEVVQGIDLDQREMVATVRAFSKKLDGAEAAFFYYAGHGIQIDGGNFLLATDSSLEDVISVRYETLDVSSVVELMEQKSEPSKLPESKDEGKETPKLSSETPTPKLKAEANIDVNKDPNIGTSDLGKL